MFSSFRRSGVYQAILCALFALHSSVLLAVTEGEKKSSDLPIPDKVARQVWFWENVFKKYNGETTIIHDWHDPEIIIDIINFKDLAKRTNDGRPFSWRERRGIVDRYVKRYYQALSRFATDGKKAAENGPMEQRIYNVYFRSRTSSWRVMNRKVVLRTQDGMSDEFARAAMRAQDYLPYMEKIFKEEEIPTDLTRIAFVESMFNPFAKSKVGAAGMWQFMGDTARKYLYVNHYIDERQAPLKATRAAARLLKANYEILHQWPMAVTAYNYGAAGLIKAMKRYKTKDLGVIINNHQSDRFGFASRNFYSEFIAARNVYGQLYKDVIGPHQNNPLNIAKIRLKWPISVADIVRHTPLKAEVLREYNLCLLPKAFGIYQDKLLPENFELIVPKEMESTVRISLNKLGHGNKGSRKR